MNTPSHLILTAAVVELLPAERAAKRAALLGAVAPDIPLFFLSAAGYLYFHRIRGMPGDVTMRHIYGDLFFHDPLWLALQNLLHAPLLLCGGLLWLWRRKKDRDAFWKSRLVWFLLSCLFHTAIDIPTHYDDGPLLFFPLDWHTRFHSPVSYWDARHFGAHFVVFEVTLDIALLGFLLVRHILRRRRPPD